MLSHRAGAGRRLADCLADQPPLKAMAKSAETVGRGQTPAPLPVDGAEELSRLAKAFNLMATDLQRHEQDRSEVLAGISHDLRTPLTRLRLEAEMSIADSGAQQAVIADIEQMEAVISQFMDYARAESGEEAVVADLTYLLENIVERQACVGRPCRLELAELPELPLRPKAITRAITNLIDNAWKYGGGEVTVKTAAVDGEIWLEISDHGPGIPASETERLKRPFTRLETARTNASGTGLGWPSSSASPACTTAGLICYPTPAAACWRAWCCRSTGKRVGEAATATLVRDAAPVMRYLLDTNVCIEICVGAMGH
jgi:two-component system osmolarity sensor histidine kinase EnvZ